MKRVPELLLIKEAFVIKRARNWVNFKTYLHGMSLYNLVYNECKSNVIVCLIHKFRNTCIDMY